MKQSAVDYSWVKVLANFSFIIHCHRGGSTVHRGAFCQCSTQQPNETCQRTCRGPKSQFKNSQFAKTFQFIPMKIKAPIWLGLCSTYMITTFFIQKGTVRINMLYSVSTWPGNNKTVIGENAAQCSAQANSQDHRSSSQYVDRVTAQPSRFKNE